MLSYALMYDLGNHSALSLQNSGFSLFLGVEGTGYVRGRHFHLKVKKKYVL